MRLYTLFAFLSTSLAYGGGEIGKTKETKGKDVLVAPSSTYLTSTPVLSGVISMNVNTKVNVQSSIQTVRCLLM